MKGIKYEFILLLIKILIKIEKKQMNVQHMMKLSFNHYLARPL